VPIHVQQDYVQRPASRTCQVIGDSGKVLVDLNALTVNVFDGQGNLSEFQSVTGFDRNQLFQDELQHFLACLQRREVPLVPIREGAQSLRMALAAKESIITGQVVELGW